MSEAYLWIVPAVFVGACLAFGTVVMFAAMIHNDDPETLAVWGLVTRI